jgi:hypothetical protein
MRKIVFEEIYNELNGDWGHPSSVSIDDSVNNLLDGAVKNFCHSNDQTSVAYPGLNNQNLIDFLFHTKWLFELTNKIKTPDQILLEKLQGNNHGR